MRNLWVNNPSILRTKAYQDCLNYLSGIKDQEYFKYKKCEFGTYWKTKVVVKSSCLSSAYVRVTSPQLIFVKTINSMHEELEPIIFKFTG